LSDEAKVKPASVPGKLTGSLTALNGCGVRQESEKAKHKRQK